VKGKKILAFLFVCLIITITVGFSPITSKAESGLPTHLLTGYWQNFNNGAKCLRISDVPVAYDIIAVAFADATSTPGAVDFTLDSGLSSALGGYTKSQFISDIAAAKARGQKVIISVGGQNGTVRVADSNAATNFANSVYSLMTEYGFDGVDIDLENGVDPTYMASALHSLSSKAGADLIITMAPETLYMQSPQSTYFQLALNIKDILTIVNTQYYNSGSMLGYDGKIYSQGNEDFLTALATIQLENGLRPDQVGLGLPASPSGAGGGYVSPSVVNAAIDCLYDGSNAGSFKPPQTYPTIRGAMTWSINWDASNGYNFANTVKPHLNSLGGGGQQQTVVTPTFGPAGGTYNSAQSVTISCATSGAVIRYTTDGSTPNSNSPVYSGPINVSSNTTIKAYATAPGMYDSAIASAIYTINIEGNYPAWAPNTAYKAGEIVSYSGKNYKCIQAHTSLIGWEPSNVPALWQEQ
jgi:chitinase